MKKLKFGLLFSALVCFGLTISSCNNAKSSDKDMTEESTEAAASETDMSGPEHTSAYVCPMHCKGSGSAEAGNCPVCGMEYVANEAMKATDEGKGEMEGDMETEGEEGAEEGHEGHNHG